MTVPTSSFLLLPSSLEEHSKGTSTNNKNDNFLIWNKKKERLKELVFCSDGISTCYRALVRGTIASGVEDTVLVYTEGHIIIHS
jgi:hypothetical protein